MENITRGCLNQKLFPKDFAEGEKIRLYITYWGSCTDIKIIEGTVLDTLVMKEGLWPSLKLEVNKKGWVYDRKIKTRDVNYKRSYMYANIGLVDRLEE